MRTMENLIRLGRQQLDSKRRMLSGLEGLRVDLEKRVSALEVEITTEQAAAQGETSFAYDSYAKEAIHRRETLAKSVSEIAAQIAAAREEVAEAYREMKKFEIMEERRQQQARAARLRREQAELDEIGGQAHHRSRNAP